MLLLQMSGTTIRLLLILLWRHLLWGPLRLNPTAEQLVQEFPLYVVPLVPVNGVYLEIELGKDWSMVREDSLSPAVVLQVNLCFAGFCSLVEDTVAPGWDATFLGGVVDVLTIIIFVSRIKI